MKDPLAPHRHCITEGNRRKGRIARANTVCHKDIERIVWKQTNIPLRYCRLIIKEAIKQIVYHVARGHRFVMPDFGALFHRKHRAGNGKVVDTICFSTNFSMREDLIDGEYKKSCLNVHPNQREERRKRVTKPVAIQKVPRRLTGLYYDEYIKSWKTEIEENLELAKPNKWAKKKRRKPCRRNLNP